MNDYVGKNKLILIVSRLSDNAYNYIIINCDSHSNASINDGGYSTSLIKLKNT